MPCLSIRSIFLLLAAAVLLFRLTPTIYAEGLSGLKDSLNKGKIDSTLEEQTKQQADIADVPQSSTVKNKTTTKFQNFIKSFQKVNIFQKGNISKQLKIPSFNLPKDIEKYIAKIKTSTVLKKESNLKKTGLKNTLLKFLKKPDNKLKRIGEKTLPVKLQAEQSKAAKIWISPLPSSFPPAAEDTTELEAINAVIDFHSFINDPEFYNDSIINLITKMVQIEDILLQAYEENSEYPYICAMLKFYCTEMRVNILGYFDASYTAEKKFDQIYETYYANRFDNECCRDILTMTLNRKSQIVLFISNEMSKRINEADTYIKNVNNYLKEMSDTVYPSEGEAPSKDWVETVYSEITSSYQTIISSNLQKGDYNEARRKLLEMEKYYSEIPSKFKVKYLKEAFNSDTQQYEKVENSKIYDIKKHTQQYFAAIESYVKDGGNYSEVDEESCENVLKDINAYIDKVKKYVPSDNEECSPETLKYFQEQIDNKSSSSETSDHYYSQNRNITKMYFTRTENKELDSNDIPDPKDNLALRCETDSKGPLYPFKQDIISATSDRKKTLKLKKDWFYAGNYYAIFQPNETDNPKDKEKNLINVTPPWQNGSANIKSVATYHGEKKFDYPSALWGSSYFNMKLMKSVVKDLYDSNDRENVISSPSFLKAGGAEYIVAEKDNIKYQALIKHTADYFVVTGHGSESTGMAGEAEYNVMKNGISPEELITVENGAITHSEYDNMRFLVLAVCNCLNHYSNSQYNNAEKWYKVLPNGVILGYQGNTWNIYNDNALKIMANYLSEAPSQNFSPYTVGYLWAKSNKNSYSQSHNKNSCTNDQYAFIVNGAYFHGEWIIKNKQKRAILDTLIKPISLTEKEN